MAQVARPHRCDEALTRDVTESLWRLGVPCDEWTSRERVRERVMVRLWDREAEPSDGFPSGPGRSGNHPTGRRLSTRKILGKYHICTMPQKRLLQQTEAWAVRQITSPLMNRIWLHR